MTNTLSAPLYSAANEDTDIQILPMMPLRGMLVFPHMTVHLDVGRDRSINAVEEAMSKDNNYIFLSMQKDARQETPEADDINPIGVIARINQLLKIPGGTMRLQVTGIHRAQLVSYIHTSPFILAQVLPLAEEYGDNDIELEALSRVMKVRFDNFAQNSKRVSPENLLAINSAVAPSEQVDMIAAQLNIRYSERQELLNELNVPRRMETVLGMLDRELEIITTEKIISNRVRQQMEKSQKEYYLREQMKAIQAELGEGEDRNHECELLREKAQAANLPDYVMDKVESELKRLEKMPPMAAESTVISGYVENLIEIPWNVSTEDKIEIKHAAKILDHDHYGLEKPKERIIEYLASCQLTNSLKGPIICLVGPPGVGKTSLARSIASAVNRKFIRMSLGGVRDEAEIRGHRRTYIGSMPGRIIQSLKTCGVNNPLFLLDEIDKLNNDYHGDPAAALLEALDPEQNNTFTDHYLDLPFDLSRVMFITTANVRHNIPRPLQDRMEIIELSSYTEEEKVNIATRHLISKQLKEHGLTKKQVKISEKAVRRIIHEYTAEAGVRELERHIAKLCRKVSCKIVMGESGPFSVTERNLHTYLGTPRYLNTKIAKKSEIGVATGLAWTEVGGELLQIEVQSLPGKGKLTITGQLGDVMKESAQAGYTYIRSQAKQLNIPEDIDDQTDIHIHVPEGAIPKDGPSAGITMATALVSQLSGRKVRGDIAMTGEITLRGHVLPVGGIKEKLLAAWRNDIREIIIPKENQKDLEELPPQIREQMIIHPVEETSEVFSIALID